MSLVNQTLIKELSDAGAGGTRLGQTSLDLCSFWGASPAAQPTITAVGTTTATTTLNETKIDRLYTALRTIGLINTAG